MASLDGNRNQMTTGEASGESSDRRDGGLLDILHMFMRRKWLVVFGVVIGVALGCLYQFQATPKYESTVEILIVPKDSNMSKMDGSRSGDSQQQSASEDILSTQMQMFVSPRVLKQALKDGTLRKAELLLSKVVNEQARKVVDERLIKLAKLTASRKLAIANNVANEVVKEVVADWEEFYEAIRTAKATKPSARSPIVTEAEIVEMIDVAQKELDRREKDAFIAVAVLKSTMEAALSDLDLEDNQVSEMVADLEEGIKANLSIESITDLKLALKVGSLVNLPTLADAIDRDKSPVEYIREKLVVTRGGEGKASTASVLGASLRTPSAQDSAMILQAVVDSYERFLSETFESTSSDAIDVIKTAKVEIASELEEKEAAYLEFRMNAPLTWNGDDSLNMHQEHLRKAEVALSEIETRKAETQSRLDVIREALAEKSLDELSELEQLALLSGTDTNRLELLLKAAGKEDLVRYRSDNPELEQSAQTQYQRLLTLMLEETKLMEDFGTDHPKILAIREQIKLIHKFLKDNEVNSVFRDEDRLDPGELLEAQIGLLEHDLSELEKRETALGRIVLREEEAAKKMAGSEIEGEMKSAELTRLRGLHDAVLSQLRDLSLVKDYGGFLTEVISPVERAERPCSPILLLSFAAGGVFGLFLGGGLAYLVDITDRTFRDPDELHQALGIPVMAHIPALGVQRRKNTVTEDADGRAVIDASVIVAHRPKSWQAEAFRGLRTAMHFSEHSSKCRVIQVTSANPKDGKTTVTANMAVSFAQTGKRVLLVDCDFRRPRIGRVFGIESNIGLAEVIMGEAEPLDTIIPSEIENLWILPCGHSPSNPSELLTSPEFERFVEVMRDQYDMVVIDSPPMLAVSDPAVIAPRMDGVLMTVRITKHGRANVIHAKEILDRVGANILGVVVNGSGQGKGYGNYGKPGKGYGYGYGYGGGSYGGGYGYGSGYGSGYNDETPYHDEEEVSLTS